MLGLSFQPARRERHRPVACWRCRTQSGIAARLPLHAGAARLGAHLDRRDLHPVPGRPEQARAGHGDDGDGAGRDGPREPLRLSRDAEGHDRRDQAERAGSSEDHRSHSGRARRSRRRRPMPGSTPRTIMPAPASSISKRSRRKTPKISGPFASIAPSSRPRCRRARSSITG